MVVANEAKINAKLIAVQGNRAEMVSLICLIWPRHSPVCVLVTR